MFLEFKDDGTVASPDETGTWVASGNTLTISMPDATTYNFAVEGDVFWLGLEDEGCSPFSPEAINEDDWDAWVSAQTTPSICE